jgi:prepilin-type N-terminal cleavage/methylation domain-containing protein
MRTSTSTPRQTKVSDAGFTILELMIATMVFSVILLVVAAGILSFTNQYIKGITSSNTQAAARTLMADVAQTIQFSSGQVTPPAGLNPTKVCVGNVAYYYEIGKKVTAAQHGLVKDIDSCNGSVNFTGNLSGNQHEMLNKNMRIGEFSVQQLGGNAVAITVSVVAGEDDMISDKNGYTVTNASFDWPSVHCKSGAGSQFCAVSRLTTFVQGRIGG